LERNGLRTGREAHRTAAIMRDATGGNPFLLRETCRDLSTGSAEWVPSAPVPYAASIAARLSSLTTDEHLVISVAAVMGEEVQVAELADAVSRYAGRPFGRDTILLALARAKTTGLLDPGSGDVTVTRFPHALARQAVTAGLSDLELALVHAAIANVLDEGHPTATRRTVRLAAHFAGAAVLGYESEAVRHLTRAGDLARASSAHVEAADCYELAASYAEDPLERDHLLLSAARSALLGWQTTGPGPSTRESRSRAPPSCDCVLPSATLRPPGATGSTRAIRTGCSAQPWSTIPELRPTFACTPLPRLLGSRPGPGARRPASGWVLGHATRPAGTATLTSWRGCCRSR